MKILTVSLLHNYALGGAVTATRLLCNRFINSGLETDILTMNGGDLPYETGRNGYLVKALNLKALVNLNNSWLAPRSFKIVNAIRFPNYDAIYAADLHSLPIANHISKRIHAPLFVTLHEVFPRSSMSKIQKLLSFFNTRYLSGLLDEVDQVACVSNFVKQSLPVRWSQKARVILNPMEMPPIVRIQTLPHLFYGGRLSKEKGILLLIDAVRKLDVPLLIYGLRGNVEHKVERAAIENPKISFVKNKSEKETRYAMANCRAVCVPSITSEAYGMMARDARALECPVIAPDHSGLAECLTGYQRAAWMPGDFCCNQLIGAIQSVSNVENNKIGEKELHWRKMSNPDHVVYQYRVLFTTRTASVSRSTFDQIKDPI